MRITTRSDCNVRDLAAFMTIRFLVTLSLRMHRDGCWGAFIKISAINVRFLDADFQWCARGLPDRDRQHRGAERRDWAERETKPSVCQLIRVETETLRFSHSGSQKLHSHDLNKSKLISRLKLTNSNSLWKKTAGESPLLGYILNSF